MTVEASPASRGRRVLSASSSSGPSPTLDFQLLDFLGSIWCAVRLPCPITSVSHPADLAPGLSQGWWATFLVTMLTGGFPVLQRVSAHPGDNTGGQMFLSQFQKGRERKGVVYVITMLTDNSQSPHKVLLVMLAILLSVRNMGYLGHRDLCICQIACRFCCDVIGFAVFDEDCTFRLSCLGDLHFVTPRAEGNCFVFLLFALLLHQHLLLDYNKPVL